MANRAEKVADLQKHVAETRMGALGLTDIQYEKPSKRQLAQTFIPFVALTCMALYGLTTIPSAWPFVVRLLIGMAVGYAAAEVFSALKAGLGAKSGLKFVLDSMTAFTKKVIGEMERDLGMNSGGPPSLMDDFVASGKKISTWNLDGE